MKKCKCKTLCTFLAENHLRETKWCSSFWGFFQISYLVKHISVNICSLCILSHLKLSNLGGWLDSQGNNLEPKSTRGGSTQKLFMNISPFQTCCAWMCFVDIYWNYLDLCFNIFSKKKKCLTSQVYAVTEMNNVFALFKTMNF